MRDTAGHEAHAATFIPQRLILLDEKLRRQPKARERILVHELFHFVWVRLGNPRRRAWEELLQTELRERARGETGWSAEWRKRELRPTDTADRSRRWREYACESFCDTAAWMFSGNPRECTLGHRRRADRSAWFETQMGKGPFPI